MDAARDDAGVDAREGSKYGLDAFLEVEYLCFGGVFVTERGRAAECGCTRSVERGRGQHMSTWLQRALGGLAIGALGIVPLVAQSGAQASNVILVAHHTLTPGKNDGGEGLAIQLRPDGRRILYLAHESQKTCLSVIDVTRPEAPVLLKQIPSPAPGIRAATRWDWPGSAARRQPDAEGRAEAGGHVGARYQRHRPRASSQDAAGHHALVLRHLGPEFARRARAVVRRWRVRAPGDRHGRPRPTHPNDDQFYVIVDVQSPDAEGSRSLVVPGDAQGRRVSARLPPGATPQFDSGFRAHQTEVWPDQPDRPYLGYINGGVFTLDISGLADVKAGRATTFTPKVLGRLNSSRPSPA